MQLPIWVHPRANIGSREGSVMGLESRAVSAQVTKHFATFSVTLYQSIESTCAESNQV